MINKFFCKEVNGKGYIFNNDFAKGSLPCYVEINLEIAKRQVKKLNEELKEMEQYNKLANYLLDACKLKASGYNMQAPATFDDAKKMIKAIFEKEKRFEIKQKSYYNAFKGWMLGLCFCSPIMQDLSNYSSFEKKEQKEIDVICKAYDLIFD